MVTDMVTDAINISRVCQIQIFNSTLLSKFKVLVLIHFLLSWPDLGS